jgi:Fur family transcriptional regulator, peroxide stress response regulator
MKKGELRAAFHRSKMRLTRQRLAIYRELAGRYDHPDVDTLFRAVKPKVPQISLFTVYRTMNALEGAGMVWRVATFKGHARYDGDVETHAHFLCETCGKSTMWIPRGRATACRNRRGAACRTTTCGAWM